MNTSYSLGTPGYIVWSLHIAIGFLLIYIGYNLVSKTTINHNFGYLLLILGTLAIAYHAHLWYLNYTNAPLNIGIVKN